MRSRPEMEIRMPRSVRPGEVFSVELVLKSSSRTPIDWIELRLVGSEILWVTDKIQETRALLRQIAQLSGEGALEEGTTRYDARFEVPFDLPPSYMGSFIERRYQIEAQVSIPWWPDAREQWEMTIAKSPATRPVREPVAGAMARRGKELFLELSLSDRCYGPGDEIEGALAIGNLRGRRPSALDLSLVGREDVRVQGRLFSSEAFRMTSFKGDTWFKGRAVGEGRELPFRFSVPKQIHASFETAEATLAWQFEVELELEGGERVRHALPIQIESFEGAATRGVATAPIGQSRWRSVWAKAGGEFGLELAMRDLVLSGEMAGVSVEVRIGDLEGKGEGLIASLRWAEWGLGLVIRARRLFERSQGLDDLVGNRFRVLARDPAQLRVFFSPTLGSALTVFEAVDLSDEGAEVWASVPVYQEGALVGFLERVQALADAIAVSSSSMPPPPAMVELLPSYRRAAELFGARLVVGSMSLLDAHFEGGRFDFVTLFDRDARPERTKVVLHVDPPMPAGVGEAVISPSLAKPVRLLLDALSERAQVFAINEERFEIEVEAPLADPTSLRESMETMLALTRELRGERGIGPYR